MALRILGPDEPARLLGCIVWVEDLERAGLTYGDLIGFLADLHIQCVCSPVHDRDRYTAEDVRSWRRRHIDPDTGEVASQYTNREPAVGDSKKPHIHVYFYLRGKRKPREMSGYMDLLVPGLIAPNRWAYVPSWYAIVRYCAHMDDQSKAQYSRFDVLGFANADLTPLADDRNVDKLQISLEIEKAIRDERISNYWDLNQWANRTGDTDIMHYVKGRTAYFVSLFKARADKQKWMRERKLLEEPPTDVYEIIQQCDEDVNKLIG